VSFCHKIPRLNRSTFPLGFWDIQPVSITSISSFLIPSNYTNLSLFNVAFDSMLFVWLFCDQYFHFQGKLFFYFIFCVDRKGTKKRTICFNWVFKIFGSVSRKIKISRFEPTSYRVASKIIYKKIVIKEHLFWNFWRIRTHKLIWNNDRIQIKLNLTYFKTLPQTIPTNKKKP
jgi:hypothetical protein